MNYSFILMCQYFLTGLFGDSIESQSGSDPGLLLQATTFAKSDRLY